MKTSAGEDFTNSRDFTPPIYNVWKTQNKSNTTSHFGNSEAQWVDKRRAVLRPVRCWGRSSGPCRGGWGIGGHTGKAGMATVRRWLRAMGGRGQLTKAATTPPMCRRSLNLTAGG